METTRREALLLAAYAASHVAAAQGTANHLSISNAQGIAIRPFGDESTPAITVSLPGNGTEAVAVIEMPEHAWHKKGRSDEPEWFYRMYTNDERMKAKPKWSREANGLAYSMTVPSGLTLSAKATLDKDGVEIEYQIVNPEKTGYAEVQAPTCIKLYRPFTDVFLERTYVHHTDGLSLLASETPERLSKNAEEWLPCRYIVRCASDAVPPTQRVERGSDGITHYNKLRPADTPFLATESNPKGWVAATHSLSSPDVWTNPARTCHHADSGAPLGANASAKLSLKLHLLRGGVREAWARIAERARDHQL
jgi:hypothetical protein